MKQWLVLSTSCLVASGFGLIELSGGRAGAEMLRPGDIEIFLPYAEGSVAAVAELQETMASLRVKLAARQAADH